MATNREDESREVDSCELCGLTSENGATLLRCQQCKQVLYCSKDCQKEHWPDHKRECIHPHKEFQLGEFVRMFHKNGFLPLENQFSSVGATPVGELPPVVCRRETAEELILMRNDMTAPNDPPPHLHLNSHNGKLKINVMHDNSLRRWLQMLVPIQLWKDGFGVRSEHDSEPLKLLEVHFPTMEIPLWV